MESIYEWVRNKKKKGKSPKTEGFNEGLQLALSIYQKHNYNYVMAKDELKKALKKYNAEMSNRDEGRSEGINSFISKVRE